MVHTWSVDDGACDACGDGGPRFRFAAAPLILRNAICGRCVELQKAWLRDVGALQCRDCGRWVCVVAGADRCVPCRMAHTAATEPGGCVVLVSSPSPAEAVGDAARAELQQLAELLNGPQAPLVDAVPFTLQGERKKDDGRRATRLPF